MESEANKVCVLGLGYVGLTLSVTLAEAGFDVVGVDASPQVVNTLAAGRSPFYEEGLEDLLRRHVGVNIQLATEIPDSSCNWYVISVGTPVDGNKKPDCSFLESATRSVARKLKKKDAVVIRSTVPIGVSRQVALRILESESGLAGGRDFFFAFAPERTIEGRALVEQCTIPQIIGAFDEASAERVAQLFRPFNKQLIPLPDMEHAEMLKVIDNTYRDVTFAYANQMALICEKLALNVNTILAAVNLNYPRNRVPRPSPGVGGACLTKDPYLLIDLCKRAGVSSKLIAAGREINEYMPIYLGEKVVSKLSTVGKSVYGAKLFVLGFAFKGNPETSDMRFSTTLDLLSYLRPFHPRVFGYDRIASADEISRLGVRACEVVEGFQNADAVVIMNDHPSYKDFDITALLDSTSKPCVFYDCWNIFPAHKVRGIEGILYGGIGLY